MAAAAILKNRKIAISRPRFERFRPNLARQCRLTLFSCATVKSFKFYKFPDGGGRHLGKSKNGQISGTVRPIAAKFGTMMYFDPLHGTLAIGHRSHKLFKKQDDGRLSAWVEKSHYLGNSSTDIQNLAQWCILTLQTRSAVKITEADITNPHPQAPLSVYVETLCPCIINYQYPHGSCLPVPVRDARSPCCK